MANYANLLATIAANIYTNNNNEVTAAMVKTAVDQMVASLGAGYQFMGVATPDTTPGSTDIKQFYIASTPGTYTDFLDASSNPLVVYDGEVAVLKYDTAWSKEVVFSGRESVTWVTGQMNSLGTITANSKRATIGKILPLGDSPYVYVCGVDMTKYRVQVTFYHDVGGVLTYDGALIQEDYDNASCVQYRKSFFPSATMFSVNLINKTSADIDTTELKNIQASVYVSTSFMVIPGKQIYRYKFGGEGNDMCFVRTPSGYDPKRVKPYPFVICNHGNGWTMGDQPSTMNWTKRTMYVPLTDPDYISDPTQYNGTADATLWWSNPTIEALLAAGFIVCGCENYGDELYGNENCRKACADFYYHIRKFYNVENRCCMIGASNGAQTSINAAYLLGDKVKAMILQYPLTCLVNQYFDYPSHQAGIRSAYGISNPSPTEEELISATRTHDVLHTDMAGAVKVGYFPPTKFYYSEGDGVVNYEQNTIAMYDMLDESLKICDKVKCTGDHGDASHFDPPAYVNFFESF